MACKAIVKTELFSVYSFTDQPQIDPHLWLEDVLGKTALTWVERKNKQCIHAIGDPTKTQTFKRILSILDSKDKIPHLYRIGGDGGLFYNFWQDDKHVQGIWRKCTFESFRAGSPNWSTVIDFDALPPPTLDTAKTWVWHGSKLLDEGPGGVWDRALIKLSPGGSDADTCREFDLSTEKWVKPADGGFAMPKAAKTRINYRSRNEVLVGTDFGGDKSSLTDSGYPRVVKSWRRGTPITEAKTVYEVEQTDISASQYAYHDRGFVHEFQLRSITFYTSKYRYRMLPAGALSATTAAAETTKFADVLIPEDASLGTFAGMGLLELRTDWKPPSSGKTFGAGSLITAPMTHIMKNDWSKVECLFEPTESMSLSSKTETKDYIILKVLTHVRTKLVFCQFDAQTQTFTKQTAKGGEDPLVPAGEDVAVSSLSRNPDETNAVWFWRDGYLVPDTLEMGDASDCCAKTIPMKAKPAMFDASALCVEQHFATSLDGTKVPYFVMRPKALVFDGNNPTLLDAYGGFEISMLPGYYAAVGAGWLERGGVKVIANIRGGGEYGPKWHQAALKEKRHKAYEDVEAVAADLLARHITSPPKLAVIGGSNGGLMVGNMLARPVASRLFGAAVCQVPLLDMKRYSHLLAGASWMAEYGNPDTDEWKFLRKHSAYQLLRHDCLGLPEFADGRATAPAKGWRCPKVLFTTSTRDDRVHPGHARKMVRALEYDATKEQAPEVYYWENTEGGHGGAADNKQRAHMWSLIYSFLVKTLGLLPSTKL